MHDHTHVRFHTNIFTHIHACTHTHVHTPTTAISGSCLELEAPPWQTSKSFGLYSPNMSWIQPFFSLLAYDQSCPSHHHPWPGLLQQILTDLSTSFSFGHYLNPCTISQSFLKYKPGHVTSLFKPTAFRMRHMLRQNDRKRALWKVTCKLYPQRWA
jgi:hypothetical protein